MIWVENQLIGAYEGQTLVLECTSEAYPRPIVYWTRPTNETIVNGKFNPLWQHSVRDSFSLSSFYPT